jgi:hypothetical protein
MSESGSRGHEHQDLNIRAVAVFAAALALFGLASHVGLLALFGRYWEREERRDTPPPPLRDARVVPPAPRLQESSDLDREELRRREEKELRTYGWVDRDQGVVRIPIDRAMKLILERGLPVRPAPRTAD